MAGLGGSHGLYIHDMEAKASVAKIESEAISGQRLRNMEGALSDRRVARRVRNEAIAGILALAGLMILVYIVFFVLL